MKITVLGSGDTRGIPKAGCKCATCTDALKSGFERKRFGLIVESGNGNPDAGVRILVDASPDLRRCFLQLGLSSSDFGALLLTHGHYDHVCGLGDFFYEGKTVALYGRQGCLDAVLSRESFGYLKDFNLFDVHPTEYFEPFKVGALKVTPLPVEHSTETQGFLFEENGKKVAVLSDCRPEVPEKTAEAVKGADLLLTDGWLENREQYVETYRSFLPHLSEKQFAAVLEKKRLNHFLIPDAKVFGKAVRAKKTVVLHIAHGASPHAELVKKYEDDLFKIGFDGMVLEV